ncbi:OmpH family outer membrane protein [Thermodesulfobacteriota bacterium]
MTVISERFFGNVFMIKKSILKSINNIKLKSTKMFHMYFSNPLFVISLSIPLIFLDICILNGTAICADRSYYTIQIAAHKKLPNTEKHVLQLQVKGYDVFYKKVDIPGKGEWYRVYLGHFENKEKALTFSKELKAAGITDYSMIHKFVDILTVGVIDTMKIFRESKASKSADASYFKDLEAKRAVFNSRQKKVLELEESLKNGDIKVNYSDERKKLKRLKASLEEELKKKREELRRALLTEIREIVKTFSQREKYLILLEKKKVVIIDETVDVTDKIIEFYDTQKN